MKIELSHVTDFGSILDIHMYVSTKDDNNYFEKLFDLTEDNGRYLVIHGKKERNNLALPAFVEGTIYDKDGEVCIVPNRMFHDDDLFEINNWLNEHKEEWISEFIKPQEELENIQKSYFDIHVTFGPDDGDGYSVFVELDGSAGEQDAVDKAVEDCLFQEPEDIGKIDYIEQIDKFEYYEWTGKEMPVESWEDVQKKYPMEREKMDEETEVRYIEDCFKMYEKEGFSKVYWSPFTDNEERKGQEIEIVGRCTTENRDLCTLPMWEAKFPDGKIIQVYPEEVIPSEMRANGCSLFDEKKPAIDNLIENAAEKQAVHSDVPMQRETAKNDLVH